jgi:RHS repeat-associated protein
MELIMLSNLWAQAGLRRLPSSTRTRRPTVSLCITPLEERLVPATFRWVNPAGGDFATAANWEDQSGNAGVPGASDDAIILVSGVTVTSVGTTTVRNLTSAADLSVTTGSLTVAAANLLGTTTVSGGSLALGGPSTAATVDLSGGTLGGAGPLTVTGNMDWNGGTVAGGLHVAAGATLGIGGIAQEVLDNGTLTNDGTVTWEGTGTVEFRHNAAVVNRGLFRDLADHAATYAGDTGEAAAFHNSGTYEKAAGAGVSSLDFLLANTGTVRALSGTLRLDGGISDLSVGVWYVRTILDIPGAALSYNNADITLDGPGADFTPLSASSLYSNSGSLTLIGGANFNTGYFTNSGSLTIGPGSTFTASSFNQYAYYGTNPHVAFQVAGRPGSGQYGRIADSGQTNFNGGTIGLTLMPGADTVSGDVYTLINATGGVSGTLPPVTQDGSGTTTVFAVAGGSNTVTASATQSVTDLAVIAVLPPLTPAAPGDGVAVAWTVQNTNLAAATTVSDWTDSVYVSQSPTFDDSAVLVATVPHTGGLAAGATYGSSLNGQLPGLLPGDYYVFVRTDTDTVVPDADRTDNVGVSAATFTVTDLPASQILTLDTPVNGTFAAGGNGWFQVDVPGGTPLRLTATFAAGAGELSVDYRIFPTADSSLASASDPASTTQVVALTATQPGTYYVHVHGTGGGAFTLLADRPTFAVTRLVHTTGSNLGNATVTIHGVGFTPKTTVSLVKGATIRAATKVQYVSSDTLYASFSLKRLATGSYDVKVSDGTNTVTTAGGFTVNAAVAGFLEYHFPQVTSTAIGQDVIATIDFRNPGGTDVPAPLVIASSSTFNARVRLAEDPAPGPNDYGYPVYFLPTSTDAPAGIIPAGYQGTIEVIVRRTSGTDPITLKLEEVNAGKAIEWNHLNYALRPDSMDYEAFAGVFAGFRGAVGSNTNTYFAALRNAATYLAAVGTPVRNAAALDGFIMQQANAPLPGNFLYQVTDATAAGAGMPLDFARGFLLSIEGHYRLGRLGRGWVDKWDMNLTDGYGDAPEQDSSSLLFQAGGGHLEFVPVDGVPNTFRSEHGGAELTFDGTRFILTAAGGEVTAFRTDGQLDYVQDPTGVRVTADYDNDGRLASLARSDGKNLAFTWNTAGFIASVTDPAGRVTTFTYFGQRLVSASGPGGLEKYAYASGPAAKKHALTSVTGPDKVTTTFKYDSRGRLTGRELTGRASAIKYTYGVGGGVTITDAAGGSVTLQTNRNGAIAAILETAGPGLRTSYDADGQVSRIETPAGQVWSFTRDAAGRVTANTNPLGHTIRFTYDGDEGEPASVTDARGNATDFTRDFAGRTQSITRTGSGGTQSFVFDPVGNLVESVNRRGHAIVYISNADGRVTSRIFADGSHSDYAYDVRGNLTSATDASGTTTLEYLPNDLLAKVTYPGGEFLQFTYDAGGRRTSSVDQDGFTTKYAYDKAGRLAQLLDANGKVITKYAYDKAGRVSRKDDANKTYTTYAYDAAGRLLRLVNYKPDRTVNSRFDYTYDAAGRVASMKTDDVTTTYGYDLAGQLTSVTTPGRPITYTYDAAGNRTSMTDNGVTTTYTVNELNEVTEAVTGAVTTTYDYDADGNRIEVTNGTETTTYVWDDLNRLTGVTTPTDIFAYVYDPLDNLWQTTRDGETTTNLTDPTGLGWVTAQYDSSGLIAHYVHGLGLEARVAADGTRAFYDFDNLGNVVGLTDVTGVYVNRYSYLPFGETTTIKSGIADNPFTFVGRFGVSTDGNGLLNMRARSYDAATGGFVSDDPIGFWGGDYNVRRYAGNEPTGVVDPSGLRWCFDPNRLGWGDAVGANRDVSGQVNNGQWDWNGHSDVQNGAARHDAALNQYHQATGGGWSDVNLTTIKIHLDLLNDWSKAGGSDAVLKDILKNIGSFDPGIYWCDDEKSHPDFKFASPGQHVPGTKGVKTY